MKSVIITLVKLFVTAFFFFYIFGRIDFYQFADIMQGAHIGLLISAFLLIMLAHFVCVLRWRILMRPLMPVPTIARACGIYSIGMFFNLTFPTIIGGDVVKVYYSGKQSGIYVESFASVFLDRDIGMFAMMIIACCAVLFHPVSIPGIPVMLILWSVFILFIFGNIAMFTPRFHKLLNSILIKFKHEKLAIKIDNTSKALRIIGGCRATLWKSLVISFVNQLLGYAAIWIIALSLDIRLSPFYFIIFVPVTTLISMIPISLNGMGLREYSFMSLFGAIGVAGESCIAMGLLVSFIVILSSLPGGVVYIFFRGKADAASIAELSSQ